MQAPFSTGAYLSLAGGANKEISPSLSGDGDASSLRADFNSPWGWFVDFGVLWFENWSGAVGASLRYTHARYTYRYENLDASSFGSRWTSTLVVSTGES